MWKKVIAFYNCYLIISSDFITFITAKKAIQMNSYWRYRGAVSFTTKYKTFFVLDFEATCDKNKLIKPQEIIEFPCLKVDSENFTTLSIFHKYVRPIRNPQLTDYCFHLTGINQETVDKSDPFPEVFKDFEAWLKEHFIMGESIFVTCGNWDLKTMLPNQCANCNLKVPEEVKMWINLKTAAFQATGYFPRGLQDMTNYLQIPLLGKLHSGIDDCKNMVRIMKQLKQQNFAFKETDSIA